MGTGRLVGSRSRRMLRRNSVSMIIENPVLAQVGVSVFVFLYFFELVQYPPVPQCGVHDRREPGAGAGGVVSFCESACFFISHGALKDSQEP